ncbi:MAG: PD-(D/E)XK nuclease family protein [Thermoplasmata archaeon]|nr:PD-(D/E)XK nuclease family protein [Thermoplasmata archaeon]
METEQRKYPFSWEPGWSFSRMNTLRSCLWLYWYEYYAKRFAPGGERRKIEELRELSRFPFEIGNAVHQTIADILRDLQERDLIIPEEQASTVAVKRFMLLTENRPMVEKRLGILPAKEEIEDMKSQIRAGISTFYNSKWLAMMRDAPPEKRKSWLIDPPGFGEIRIDGRKAYAKPDLVFTHSDGRHYLLEWKTGKPRPDQNTLQVQAYLFYAKDIMGLDPESTVGIVQYLTHPEIEPIIVEGHTVDISEVKKTILAELKLIESKCEDVATNTPKPIGHFVRTEEPGFCELCKYREICRPDFVAGTGANAV